MQRMPALQGAMLKCVVFYRKPLCAVCGPPQAGKPMQRMPTLPVSVQTAQLVVHTFRRSRRRSCEWRRLDVVLSSPVRCRAACCMPARTLLVHVG